MSQLVACRHPNAPGPSPRPVACPNPLSWRGQAQIEAPGSLPARGEVVTAVTAVGSDLYDSVVVKALGADATDDGMMESKITSKVHY